MAKGKNGGKVGRPKKDPFELVGDEEKGRYDSLSVSELKEEMARVTMNEQDNISLMEADPDLREAKERVKTASADYREATKANKQRLAYLRRSLEGKGAV